jgi:hypothetical protein
VKTEQRVVTLRATVFEERSRKVLITNRQITLLVIGSENQLPDCTGIFEHGALHETAVPGATFLKVVSPTLITSPIAASSIA